MILLVDAGNTRIKWAVLTGQGIARQGVTPTGDITGLPTWLESKPERVLAACVAGEATRTALGRHFAESGVPLQWVRSAPIGHGIANSYQPPEGLGVDRYVAMIGAKRHFARDCVVVSVGTALTADMLTHDGQFLGGCIAPGPDLMRESLSRGTARVGFVAGDRQDFPRDTGAAVATGIALAMLGVVRGMRERLAAVRAADMPAAAPAVVLTGGARAGLRPLLDGEVFEMENLALEGLAWIARDLGYVG
jgi:type III pantothenate kinase